MPELTVLLTVLSEFEQAEIVRIEGEDASHLSGFGLYPGVVIQVIQRFPSYIIKTDQTEVALETQVASRIWVRRTTREGYNQGGGRRRRRRARRFNR